MNNESIKILRRNKKNILERWMAKQASDENFYSFSLNADDAKDQSDELLTELLEALNERSLEDSNSRDFEKVIDTISGISVARAKHGFSSRDTGIYVFGLKEAMLYTLKENISDTNALYEDSLKVSNILDNIAITSFDTFIKGREEVIMRQNQEITDISTPVIRVWDGILALPIIGTLDSARTQIVMESLLQEIVESGSSIAILDISGVPAVDSLVAQHLIKTVSATRLMGAECIISGIRPEIAQTVVHLGIDLSGITTKSTLASALKAAFMLLRLEVIKKSRS
jgi:rsbT co-antagonist protein RsbR